MKLVSLPLLLCLTTTGCESLPGFGADAVVGVEAKLHLLEVTGASQMQFVDNNGIQNGSPITVAQFGLDGRDDDVGGLLSYGDGFSGVEVRFTQVDMQTTNNGLATSEWGSIPNGVSTNASFFMDEWKLNYFGQLYAYEFENAAQIRFALGATLAHRDVNFRVHEVNGANRQDMKMTDNGVPYIGARVRGEYRGLALQVQVDWNARLDVSGDFEGDLIDGEVRLSYTLEDRNLTLFVGYTWSDIPATGIENGLRYDSDFSVDGYLLGARFEF